MAERIAEIITFPSENHRERHHLLPYALPARGIVSVAVAAELRKNTLDADCILRPGVDGKMAKVQGVGMARLRPEEIAGAEGIVLHYLLALFDSQVRKPLFSR